MSTRSKELALVLLLAVPAASGCADHAQGAAREVVGEPREDSQHQDDRQQGAPRVTLVDTDHDGTGDTVGLHHDPRPVATDQSDSPEGLEITRQIRQAVVTDATLSLGARNCVIVTNAGVVTLRGDVTQAEHDAIDRHARSIAGVTRVEDELHIQN